MLSIEQKMLSMVDEEKIEAIFRRLYDKEIYGFDITEHLKTWAENKKDLFVMFGEKLTIEKEVEYSITNNDGEMMRLRKNFIEANIRGKKSFALLHMYLVNTDVRAFVENAAQNSANILGIKIEKGEKISKVISKLSPFASKEEIDAVQTAYSMIFQDLVAKGSAVLSIDPVDYFTMSENDSGWSSCHSLDGCYRSGTVAYMMDETTAISYVRSSKDRVIADEDGDQYSFSNKVWRQICSFSRDRDYVIQARQYPNRNTANQNTIAEIVKDVLSTKNEIDYHRIDVEVNGTLSRLHPDNGNGELYYNDIYHNAFDDASIVCSTEYSILAEVADAMLDEGNRCYVGSYVPCLCGCGDSVNFSSTLFAEDEDEDY